MIQINIHIMDFIYKNTILVLHWDDHIINVKKIICPDKPKIVIILPTNQFKPTFCSKELSHHCVGSFEYLQHRFWMRNSFVKFANSTSGCKILTKSMESERVLGQGVCL